MSNIFTKEIKEVVPEAYLPFSAYVIQTRALPDARDCLKSGGRYILWSQYFNKNTYDKNRRKGSDVVGAVMHWNPHGDAGIYGNIVRFAKPFAMRYLLEDAKGNVGTMTAGDDHTQMRYLELRSSELASEFTKLIKKDTIDIWKMNFTQEDEYPSVFPTLFPNFVNGNTGIGVGCVSSIPQFNLIEVINSLKKLVYNRDASYDEIYVAPDFATGAILINSEAVKESLKTGRGAAAKLRAVIEYNDKENALEVKEIPYQVFTNRIMKELEKGIEEGKILGIKSYFDGTDRSCGKYGTKIIIYLNKGANVSKICKQLYKETSLQSSFTICQLMLENGITPREYGLKDMMLAYLDHATLCLKKSYAFDLKKVQKAININEGLLTALANIDEVVEIIKTSNTTEDVIKTFKEKYGLNEEQTKAILNLKLQRLMKLEAIKIEKELEKQKEEESKLLNLLNSKEEFNKAFINELDRIAKTYGDSRRTQVINLNFTSEDDDAEPIEKKELLIHYTNLGNLYTVESSTLMRTRRGTKGTKVKLSANEVITQTLRDDNFSSLLVFSNKGQMYHISTDDLPLGSKINVSQLFEFKNGEKPTALTTLQKKNDKEFFVFITKQGMIKKTRASEYNIKRGKSLKALNLKDNDEVLKVLFINNEDVTILSKNGNFVRLNTEEINAIGRAAAGVKAIKLSEDDEVLSAYATPAQSKFVVTVSESGVIKKMPISDFPITSRAIKGKKISDVKEGDRIIGYLILSSDNDIIIIVNKKVIKINTSELRELSRTAFGVKGVDLKEDEKVIGLIKEETE
jgi:DNA gyrase subunit A